MRLGQHGRPPKSRLSMIYFIHLRCSFRLALDGLLIDLGRLDARHHLLLSDQMVHTLQEAEQALHVPAPLVEDIVRVARLGEGDDAGWPVDLGVDGLRRHQLADVLLCLVLCQIQKLGQARDLDASVVLCDDADVVLNDTLAQVLPPLVCLVVFRLTLLCIEDIGIGQVRPELLRNHGPPHQLWDGEELDELCVLWDQRVACVALDAVDEIGLLVIVWCEDDEVDDALEDL